MFYIKPSILSLASDPKSKLTKFRDISDDDKNSASLIQI